MKFDVSITPQNLDYLGKSVVHLEWHNLPH